MRLTDEVIWWLERQSRGVGFGECVFGEGRGVSAGGANEMGRNDGVGEDNAGGVEGDGGGFGSN